MQVYFRKFYGLLELVFAISSRFRKRNVVTVHCLFLQLLKSCWPSWVSITRKFKNDNWPFPKMFAHLYLDITVKEISASEDCLWITLRKQRINITLSRFHLHWNVLRNGLYVIYALYLIYSIYSLPVFNTKYHRCLRKNVLKYQWILLVRSSLKISLIILLAFYCRLQLLLLLFLISSEKM